MTSENATASSWVDRGYQPTDDPWWYMEWLDLAPSDVTGEPSAEADSDTAK